LLRIDLDNCNSSAPFFCKLLKDWRHHFARPAPFGPEIGQNWFVVRSNEFIKRGRSNAHSKSSFWVLIHVSEEIAFPSLILQLSGQLLSNRAKIPKHQAEYRIQNTGAKAISEMRKQIHYFCF
jgi:hypothetical protein